MDSVILNNEINTKNDLLAMALLFSKNLNINTSIDGYYFLLALMTVESSFGAQNLPRFEHGYSRSSIAYKRSKILQEGHAKWGDLCACSYGPTQILWVVAAELGFSGHPLELWHGNVSIPYTVKLINRLAEGGADTQDRLAASYNAGLGALKSKERWPAQYVKKFSVALEQVGSKYR